MRRDLRALRAEIRTETQGLRQALRADIQSLRTEDHADFAHVRGDLAGLRKDIQGLNVRMARIEGFLVGFFAECGPATTTKSIPD